MLSLEAELERLRVSEARLRALLGCGMAGLTLIDAQGQVLFDAPLLRDDLGYRPEELVGRNVLDLVEPSQRERAVAELAQLVASPQGARCELELGLRAKDGSVRLFQVLGTNRLADPVLGGLVINTLDITERRRLEQQLRSEEQRAHADLKATWDALPDLLFEVDASGRICNYHAANASLLYAPPEQFQGRQMREVLPATAADVIEQAIGQAARHGRHSGAVYSLPMTDGQRWFELSVAAKAAAPGQAASFVMLVRDITTRRNAEDNYRRLHESMTDAYAQTDMHGRVLDCNRAFLELVGYSLDELRQMRYEQFTPPQWHALEDRILTEQILVHGYSGVYEKEYRCRDGRVVPVELRTNLIRDDQGRPLGMWAIVRDISQRKQAEAAQRESERRLREVMQQARCALWSGTITGLPGWQHSGPTDQMFAWQTDFLDETAAQNLVPLEVPAGKTYRSVSQANWFAEDRAQATAIANFALANGLDHFTQQFRSRDRFGRIHWLHEEVSLQRLEPGRWKVFGVRTDLTATKEAEEALRASETRQRLALAGAQAGGYSYDLLKQTVSCDARHREIHGLAPDQTLNFEQWLARLHPEDRSRMLARSIELSGPSSVRQWNEQYRIVHPRLGVRWLADLATIERDAEGRGVSANGIILDITERILAAEAIRQREEWLRRLSDANLIGILTTRGSRVTSANDEFLRMVGASRADLEAGRIDWQQITPPEFAAIDQKGLQELQQQGWCGAYEKEYLRPDGTRVPVMLGGVLLEPDPVSSVCFVVDLTTRKRVEQELERLVQARTLALTESEERFRQLAGSIRQVFWLEQVTPRQVLYVSPAYEEIWGRPCAALKDDPGDWQAAIHPEDQERIQANQRTHWPESAYQIEYRVVRPDGSVRWVRDSGFPIRDAAGKVYRVAGIAEDVTVAKKLDQEILRATHREQQRIGRDLHDGVCQLLIGAELTTGVLQRRLAKRKAPEATDLQYLQGVLKEAISQTRAVTRGLIPSELETGGLPLALNNLAESIPSLFQIPCTFRCGRRVNIHNTMAALHLYRIAQEAVHNAARHAKAKQIEIKLSQHQGVISLVIADDGCGIGHPRARRKTGFGLQIMQHRARMVGANLLIEPGSRGGTVVTCTCRNRKPPKTSLSSR